jgi:hypothetical protein
MVRASIALPPDRLTFSAKCGRTSISRMVSTKPRVSYMPCPLLRSSAHPGLAGGGTFTAVWDQQGRIPSAVPSACISVTSTINPSKLGVPKGWKRLGREFFQPPDTQEVIPKLGFQQCKEGTTRTVMLSLFAMLAPVASKRTLVLYDSPAGP